MSDDIAVCIDGSLVGLGDAEAIDVMDLMIAMAEGPSSVSSGIETDAVLARSLVCFLARWQRARKVGA